ncbi:hypothetical protein [Candidatus Solincola sp.]|nr:hypothetical protein [Actinomycetota bacterium]MDI7251015.1 hypothetical protein [Actinomycetota bacterium]
MEKTVSPRLWPKGIYLLRFPVMRAGITHGPGIPAAPAIMINQAGMVVLVVSAFIPMANP